MNTETKCEYGYCDDPATKKRGVFVRVSDLQCELTHMMNLAKAKELLAGLSKTIRDAEKDLRLDSFARTVGEV